MDMYCHRLVGRGPGPITASDPAAYGLSFDREFLAKIAGFDDAVRAHEDTTAASTR